MFARPGPIVDGARQRRGLLSQFCIILRLTEPFDEVVIGKSQAITPLSALSTEAQNSLGERNFKPECG